VSYDFVDPFAIDPPFFLRFTYRAEHLAAAGPDVLRLIVPLAHHPFGPGRLADYLQAVEGEERETPVLLRSAQTVDVEERIALPAGFDLVEPLDRHAASDVASFEATVIQEGRALVLRSRTRILRRNIAPADYAGLRDVVEAAREFADTPVLLERAARRAGGGR